MATPERRQFISRPPDTVPKELIDIYENILNEIATRYEPTSNYLKSDKTSSGVYLNSIDKSHHISFHTTVEKKGTNEILTRRIHVRYANNYIIHLKLIVNNGSIQLVPKEESESDFETYIKPSFISEEIDNLNKFFSNINPKGRFNIDKSQKPPTFKLDDPKHFPGLNKYLEYKLKYFILKSLFEK